MLEKFYLTAYWGFFPCGVGGGGAGGTAARLTTHVYLVSRLRMCLCGIYRNTITFTYEV